MDSLSVADSTPKASLNTNSLHLYKNLSEHAECDSVVDGISEGYYKLELLDTNNTGSHKVNSSLKRTNSQDDLLSRKRQKMRGTTAMTD